MTLMVAVDELPWPVLCRQLTARLCYLSSLQ